MYFLSMSYDDQTPKLAQAPNLPPAIPPPNTLEETKKLLDEVESLVSQLSYTIREIKERIKK